MIHKIKARDIMTTNVVTVSEDMPVRDLANFLTERLISGAPVLGKDGKLTGVVSLSDLARIQAEQGAVSQGKEKKGFYIEDWEDKFEKDELKGMHIEVDDKLMVADIMTPLVFSIEEDTPLVDMSEIMSSGRIHRLIVTKKDKVVGIVTTMDILSTIAKQMKK